MKKLNGGNKVSQGYYMNINTAEFVIPDEVTQTLPGSEKDFFVKVPNWTPVFAGPVFGLIFVILLPLAGIAGLIGFLAYKLGFASTNIGRVILSPIINGFKQSQAEVPERASREK